MHYRYFKFSILFVLISFNVFADFFCDTYKECRKNFLNRVQTISQKKKIVSVSSPTDSTLITDYVYIPPAKTKDVIVVVTSGVHGVEGPVGSAIQSMFLEKMLPGLNKDNVGYLFVHAVNAWGFRESRKVTEDNIDLNRHFLLSWDNPLLPNRDLDIISAFSPAKPIQGSRTDTLKFFGKSIIFAKKYGIKKVRQEILGGQYMLPKGLFYGGSKASFYYHQLNKHIIERVKDYKYKVLLDLHTGYGESGKLHLLEPPAALSGLPAWVEKPLSGFEVIKHDNDNFYEVTGGLSNYFMEKLGASAYALVLEYGTSDTKSTLSSINSLKKVVWENQMYHYNKPDSKEYQKIKKEFFHHFYPESEEWREKISAQTQVILPNLLKALYSDVISK